MTAEEAYAKTMKAIRNYVLEQIDASARNYQFKIEIRHTYRYKGLEDELVADGHIVSSKGNHVTISRDRPKKM